MRDIIIAYPSKDVALKLRALLESEGLNVTHICALGSSVLSISHEMREGVIICASMLSDMSAGNIADNLPPNFDVISLEKGGVESYMGNLISLPLPLVKNEFIETVYVLASSTSSFTRRDKNDSEIISDAKLIIMNSRDFTEMQAHKYLQTLSMRSGKKLVDVAKKIVNEFKE